MNGKTLVVGGMSCVDYLRRFCGWGKEAMLGTLMLLCNLKRSELVKIPWEIGD